MNSLKTNNSGATRETQKNDRHLRSEVDITSLKRLVLEFPQGWALRNAVLAERNVLKTYEFVAKMETWMSLLRMGIE